MRCARLPNANILLTLNGKIRKAFVFLGNIDYNEYVRRYLGEQVGDVVELETGKIIGQHKGLWFHTIGQRKGLGFWWWTMVCCEERCNHQCVVC